VGQNRTVYIDIPPFLVPMADLITKYHNKYVRRGLCLIYTYPTMVFFF
jgi:hypothetical protein